MRKLKKLNWNSYLFVMTLVFLASLANKNITNILEWLIIFLIGAILALFILFN